jgi:CRISPR system Cascade subunit CasA
MSFSLLTASWIPVRRACGAVDWISPSQLTSAAQDGAPVAFSWPRPDFDLAAHEFMIGLLAVAFPPRDEREWLRRYHEPPTPDELAAAFVQFSEAFSLDEEGPRFLQELDALNGKIWPIESLLIGGPGENTIRLNTDLLVKRGQVKVLSRAGAAMTIYTLQQFASGGGVGYRTSVRGGGPLSTLVIPNGEPTLWQRVWLNVPYGAPAATSRMERIFPWLAPTRTSANGESVSVDDAGVHPLQAHFGMPRRIRLHFEKNDTGRPCDLTGVVDSVVTSKFVAAPWGVNYGVWHHPLTPYYRNMNKTLPVHAPEGAIGYREWLGLVYEAADHSLSPATIVGEARSRLDALADESKGQAPRAALFAGGYSMDNAKPLTFVEAELPMHLVRDEALAQALSEFASVLVKSARVVEEDMLALALRVALFGDKGKAGWDSTVLGPPCDRLWDETNNAFHRMLDEAVGLLARDETDEQRTKLKERWRLTLERAALAIFDEVAPIDEFDVVDPARIVRARRMLALGLKGYGKYGKSFFGKLVLPLPEVAQRAHRESEGRREGIPA